LQFWLINHWSSSSPPPSSLIIIIIIDHHAHRHHHHHHYHHDFAGSNDGAKTLFQDIAELNKKMKIAAKRNNLAGHLVQHTNKPFLPKKGQKRTEDGYYLSKVSQLI
jgi:hypothetical protein